MISLLQLLSWSSSKQVDLVQTKATRDYEQHGNLAGRFTISGTFKGEPFSMHPPALVLEELRIKTTQQPLIRFILQFWQQLFELFYVTRTIAFLYLVV